MDYDQAAAAYETSQNVQNEKDKGLFDPQYYKGLPAIPKAVEIVCSLLAFICVEVSLICVPWIATFGFFKFCSMTCFVITLILYVILILKLETRIFRCSCIDWPLIEASFYGGVLVIYFFADLFLALHGCQLGHKFGCAFGFFAFFAYLADGLLAFRRYWTLRKEKRENNAPANIDERY